MFQDLITLIEKTPKENVDILTFVIKDESNNGELTFPESEELLNIIELKFKN